jgi:sterol desaturase/sphingolipid hydroxylase (fatty acid hydroxylase superfamily)
MLEGNMNWLTIVSMSDLRSLLIGIIGGIVVYYATRGINRYLARRTIRGRQRQIKQLTQELQLLERLGLTDRSLLLFAFRMLFPMIALAAVGMAGWLALSLLTGPPYSATALIFLLLSVFIAIIAAYASSVFKKLEDPEPTLANLRQKLRELQAMDDRPPNG